MYASLDTGLCRKERSMEAKYVNVYWMILLTLAACARTEGQDVEQTRKVALVRQAVPVAAIMLDAQPTRAAQFAAAELQWHVEKIAGARLPIVTSDAEFKGQRILVGESPATRALGLKSDDFKDQEYLIRFLPDGVVLMGRDKDDRGKIDYANGAGLPAYFDEQGTCYAVYDFLERFCNVRWYGPTELCMVCPTTPTLEVGGEDIRRKPAFSYREPCIWPPQQADGLVKHLWNSPSAKDVGFFWHRMRSGGQKYAANHSFYGYYDRFWEPNPDKPKLFEKAHPEWFAKGYPGKPPQMCYTDPGFIKQVIQDARDYFDGKGAKTGAQARGDFFALVPMDNADYCKCPTCEAETNKSEANNPQFSNGYASDYVFGFANKVAQEIKKTHPHKYLATIAYWQYAYYPRRIRLEPNIAVQLCLHVRNWWCPSMEKNDTAFYRSWVEKEKDRPIYLWLYYGFPEEIAIKQNKKCFPGFFAHTVARQIKMFHKDGIRGAFFNGIAEQVDTYVTFKLLDDPTQDVDQILDEFFARYYGSAANPMKKLYLRIEETYMNPANYPQAVQRENRHVHQTQEMAWEYLGTEKRMAEFGKLVEEARASAATDIEKQRVALFERGVWNYMVAGRNEYQESKKVKAR
jgi:hypothetical protein